MNCRQFDDGWNELLDSRREGPSELERALDSHASACGRCRAISARYRVLRRATTALRPIPAPSAGSIGRLHALAVPPTSPTVLGRPAWRARPSCWAPLASAAAFFALAWWGGVGPSPRDRSGPKGPGPAAPVEAATPLAEALAEAREATIDLAREASAPASRIGREVFELGKVAAEPPEDPGEAARAESEDDTTRSVVLHSVGERVTAGVRPISGSARHAFSFLLGPPPDEPGQGP